MKNILRSNVCGAVGVFYHTLVFSYALIFCKIFVGPIGTVPTLPILGNPGLGIGGEV